ncbi:peptidoglycan-associated lipoprotein Pal [Desulfonatronospira sp.]|uniref:peptidoglycan-associated lipoprotein Pal n=1 Tax=Desulfonatronospira sp. TaxID=1962951 RepID=UPI0025C24393|nr:peptidoglycan-associated lipoprotein Pal [Desulfonatronospira sp.]
MKNRSVVLLALILALFLFAGFGCGKRPVETPTDPAKELTEEERARLEEERIKEEMRRQALEERRLQEERMQREKDAEVRLQEAVDEIAANRIHFAFDSYELTGDARSTLQKISEYMKRFEELRLVVEGHTDERGTAEYNLALGERRARAAYEFLVLLGVSSNRLQIISYGQERPLVDESNESAWAQNRRAVFKVLD